MTPEDHIVIAVGHSRLNDNGAVDVYNRSEHEKNSKLARDIAVELKHHGVKATVINHYGGEEDYTEAIDWLAGEVTRIKGTLGMELHFNSAGDPTANGYEHHYVSANGERFARLLAAEQHALDPSARARQDQGVYRSQRGDNGNYMLRKTPCPFILTEPYLGSNMDEVDFYDEQYDGFVTMHVNAALRYLGKDTGTPEPPMPEPEPGRQLVNQYEDEGRIYEIYRVG